MILAFCGCCLIVFIHFYVLMGILIPVPIGQRLNAKLFVFKLPGCAGLLGASQIGKALSFDLNYCGFESRASIPPMSIPNPKKRRLG